MRDLTRRPSHWRRARERLARPQSLGHILKHQPANLVYTLELPISVARRLPVRALEPLQNALSRWADWSLRLPAESRFYLNRRPVLRPKVTWERTAARFEPDLAPVFYDYHSVLTSQVVLRGWRVSQLIEGLASALSSWNITVAASIARSLVETACAWFVKSKEIADTWNSVAKLPVADNDALLGARKELLTSLAQVFAGLDSRTFLRSIRSFSEQTCSHIEKTAKALKHVSLLEQYEELCDAVHPSFGSMECFSAEAGINEELLEARVLLSRSAVGQPGDRTLQPLVPGSGLILTVVSSAAWACERLVSDLEQFEFLCRDVCLTCHIFTLQDLITGWLYAQQVPGSPLLPPPPLSSPPPPLPFPPPPPPLPPLPPPSPPSSPLYMNPALAARKRRVVFAFTHSEGCPREFLVSARALSHA